MDIHIEWNLLCYWKRIRSSQYLFHRTFCCAIFVSVNHLIQSGIVSCNCKQTADLAFEYFSKKKILITKFSSTYIPNISGRIRPGSHGILIKLCNVFDPIDMRFSVCKFFETHRCSNSLQIFWNINKNSLRKTIFHHRK